MGIIELREKISSDLLSIDDVTFLNAIKVLVEGKLPDKIYKLSDYEKEWIENARKELKAKKTIPHEKVKEEVNAWLNSK